MLRSLIGSLLIVLGVFSLFYSLSMVFVSFVVHDAELTFSQFILSVISPFVIAFLLFVSGSWLLFRKRKTKATPE